MKKLCRCALATMVLAGAAIGSPITYTMAFTATGNIGETSFADAPAIITSIADTGEVFLKQDGGVLFTKVIASSSFISIAGVSSSTAFTDPMFWEVPQGAGDILFGDANLPGGFWGGIPGFTRPDAAGLETYDRHLGRCLRPLISRRSFSMPFRIFRPVQAT